MYNTTNILYIVYSVYTCKVVPSAFIARNSAHIYTMYTNMLYILVYMCAHIPAIPQVILYTY